MISKQVLIVLLAKMEEKGSDLPFYLINQKQTKTPDRPTTGKKKLNEIRKRPD